MAKSSIQINLSETQMAFNDSTHKYTCFTGGLGSGKTFAGAVWAALMPFYYPETTGVITANSYSQLNKATLALYFEVLDLMGIPFEYKKHESIVIVNGIPVYAMSMEKYNLLRGIEIGWAWSDECAFYRKEAFDVLIGRLRHKKGPCQWKGTTTPDGFNWLYEVMVEKPLEDSLLIRSKTKDNLANLSESYYKTLVNQYDSRLAKQELDGEFVNLSSGKVYYGFDRHVHVKEIDDRRNNIIFVGLDFNVHPLCGIFCIEEEGVIKVVDELYLEDSNTFEAARELLKRYPYRELKVIPDDSGSKRKTSSAQTDHEILRRANLEVLKFRNPEVKDRYNNTNRLFAQGKIEISPKCVKLIADLEKLIYDNKDPMLSHMTDALGYALWHLNPLKKPRRPARTFTY